MLTKLQISPFSKQLQVFTLSQHCWKDSSALMEARWIFPLPDFFYLGPRMFGTTSGKQLNSLQENKMPKLCVRTPHFPWDRTCIMTLPLLNLQLGYIFTFWFEYVSNVSESLLLLQINRISQKDGWHFCCYRNWSWCYTVCLSLICHTSIQLLNTDIFLFPKELHLKN